MSGLNELSIWDEEVYRIEMTDPVEGGENGIDNKPHKNLANRTKYLRDQLAALNNRISGIESANNAVDTAQANALTDLYRTLQGVNATDAQQQAILGSISDLVTATQGAVNAEAGSRSQADANEADTRWREDQRLDGRIDALFSHGSNENGFWRKDNTSGCIEQWGFLGDNATGFNSSNQEFAVTLPIAYVNGNYNIQLSLFVLDGAGNSGNSVAWVNTAGTSNTHTGSSGYSTTNHPTKNNFYVMVDSADGNSLRYQICWRTIGF